MKRLGALLRRSSGGGVPSGGAGLLREAFLYPDPLPRDCSDMELAVALVGLSRLLLGRVEFLARALPDGVWGRDGEGLYPGEADARLSDAQMAGLVAGGPSAVVRHAYTDLRVIKTKLRLGRGVFRDVAGRGLGQKRPGAWREKKRDQR